MLRAPRQAGSSAVPDRCKPRGAGDWLGSGRQSGLLERRERRLCVLRGDSVPPGVVVRIMASRASTSAYRLVVWGHKLFHSVRPGECDQQSEQGTVMAGGAVSQTGRLEHTEKDNLVVNSLAVRRV